MFYTVNSVVMIWMKWHHLKMLHVFVLYSYMYYNNNKKMRIKTFFLAVYSLLLLIFHTNCVYTDHIKYSFSMKITPFNHKDFKIYQIFSPFIVCHLFSIIRSPFC